MTEPVHLSPRERRPRPVYISRRGRLVAEHLCAGRSVRETAALMGITHQRVGQLIEHVAGRIAENLGSWPAASRNARVAFIRDHAGPYLAAYVPPEQSLRQYFPKPSTPDERRVAYIELSKYRAANWREVPTTCELCGATPQSNRLHGHHVDYREPLAVLWVCTGCHGAIHFYARKVAREGRQGTGAR